MNDSAFRQLVLAGALATSALAGTGCDERAAVAGPAPQAESTPVKLVSVRHERAARPLVAVGVAEGKRDVSLSFKVGGVVASVNVEEGAEVKKGQVLARVDQTEVAGALVQARESLAKAERDEKRARSFHDSGVIPVADLENAKTALEVARAGVAVAGFNAAHAVITAPEDGVVEHRSVEVGEVVGPGAPVLSVRGKSQGWVVRVGLADRDAVDVALGGSARVTFDAIDGTVFEATVTQMAERASPRTGTFETELSVDPKGAKLLSGLVAKVTIERARRQSVALVPARALVEGNGRSGAVFAVVDGAARRVPIEVAYLAGDDVAVLHGLESIESVVGDGAPFLREGSLVTVVTP